MFEELIIFGIIDFRRYNFIFIRDYRTATYTVLLLGGLWCILDCPRIPTQYYSMQQDMALVNLGALKSAFDWKILLYILLNFSIYLVNDQ